ncbi:MAG: anti-sigma factor, partial [Candidatus Dormibacteraeota bacterium]|nr:anti-sigma factor [Candidatus Dormibacteraeota bacterium]
VYELWLIPRNGAPVAAAFLAQSPLSGSWTAGVHADMAQYVSMAATLEPAGGSRSPTSAQLLSVQLAG